MVNMWDEPTELNADPCWWDGLLKASDTWNWQWTDTNECSIINAEDLKKTADRIQYPQLSCIIPLGILLPQVARESSTDWKKLESIDEHP